MFPMTDALPEWSTVDADEIETGGSFDASGAFLSSRVTRLILHCVMSINTHTPMCFDLFCSSNQFVYHKTSNIIRHRI